MRYSIHIATAMTVAALALPVISSAQTVSIDAQVQTLLGQIKALQEQLKTLITTSASTSVGWKVGSSTSENVHPPFGQLGKMVCATFARNLRPGSKGDDVKKLQEILSADPDTNFRGAVTGFFGPLTANAMAKFQMKFSIASSTDGSVGPATRGFFERSCGKGLDDMHGPMGSTSPQAQGEQGQKGPDQNGNSHGPIGAMLVKGGVMVTGTVSTVSTSSITVQSDGGTKTFLISSDTKVSTFAPGGHEPAPGSIADVTAGSKVRVIGMTSDSGVVTASMIQTGTLPPVNF